jgi:uncharacterized membrane protein YhfC
MLINSLCALALVLMIFGPIVVVISLGRKREWEPRWVVAGAVAFISSQVVHLPMNWVLAELGWMSNVSPIDPTTAVLAGLTAGLCEEGARTAVFLWWLREVRDHNQGNAYGLGHGGFEAVLLGILGVFSLVSMISLQTMDLTTLDLEPDALEAVRAQVAAFQSQAGWQVFLGPLERAMTMMNHLFMTMLVLRGVTRRSPLPIVVAVGWHALINAVTVWVMSHHSAIAAEGALAVLTIIAATGWWHSRDWFEATTEPSQDDGKAA